MVNNNTSERPLNPIAAKNWDKRQHQKNIAAANEASKKAAIREISASYAAGRETRTGMVESGILPKPTGGIVSGDLVDTGNKRKGSSW